MTAKRECGKCSLCCKLLTIEALNKPAGEWCKHCKPGKGCSIYNKSEKPNVCDDYTCMWLADYQGLFDDRWFPATCKFFIEPPQYGPDGRGLLKVMVDPAFPTAWRKEPYYSVLNRIADEFTVAICIGKRVILLKRSGAMEAEVVRKSQDDETTIPY